MADRYVETTSKSFGQNLGASLKGVLVGVILFLASFVVLWLSEGRTDWSKVARESKPFDAERVEAEAEGQFVSLEGKLAAPGDIGDPGYLRPGPYVALERKVEMFAWTEKSESKTEKKLGGGSETTTVYTYERDWTDSPRDASDFKHPEGHYNPPLTIKEADFRAAEAAVGQYQVNPARLGLPSREPLELKPELLDFALTKAETPPAAPAGAEKPAVSETPETSPSGEETPETSSPAKEAEPPAEEAAPVPTEPGLRFAGGYIYLGEGSPQQPQVGDVRISYLALPSGTEVTAFGDVRGGKLVAHLHEDSHFYRALAGSRAEALSQLATEYKLTVWIMRIIGFFAMWIGMMMMLGPIPALLDVLPFLGNLGGGLIKLVLFPVALVLSIVTILIAKVAHNPIALVVFLAAAGAGVVWLIRRKKAAKAAAPTPDAEGGA